MPVVAKPPAFSLPDRLTRISNTPSRAKPTGPNVASYNAAFKL
jgi:hypothetical protein